MKFKIKLHYKRINSRARKQYTGIAFDTYENVNPPLLHVVTRTGNQHINLSKLRKISIYIRRK